MTISEMKQKIDLCAATLMKLNGVVPGFRELYSALGREYEELLRQYLNERRRAAVSC